MKTTLALLTLILTLGACTSTGRFTASQQDDTTRLGIGDRHEGL